MTINKYWGFGVGSIGILMAVVPCFALVELPLIDQHKSVLEVSNKELTRIAVRGDRIKQIFGLDHRIAVSLDEDAGQIFVKVKGTKPINITIITESGLTQDLGIMPKAKAAESVLFNITNDIPAASFPHVPSFAKSTNKQNSETKMKPLIDRLKLMMRGENHSKFKKTLLPAIIRSYGKQLEVEIISAYKGQDLAGFVYKLTNTGEKPFNLQEKDLALSQDCAITLSCHDLAPNEQAIMYVLTNKEVKL